MTWHTIISLIKSITRIVGYIGLFEYFYIGVLLLIGAEILGIAEEIKP